MGNRYEEALRACGMEIVKKEKSPAGMEIVIAVMKTERGPFEVSCGTNGCARLVKPNGSVKWVYGKSYAQIHRIVRQVIEANS